MNWFSEGIDDDLGVLGLDELLAFRVSYCYVAGLWKLVFYEFLAVKNWRFCAFSG